MVEATKTYTDGAMISESLSKDEAIADRSGLKDATHETPLLKGK